MLIAERQSLLQELIAQHGIIDLDTLAKELDVSQSTVRRDVEQLERKQLVARTHGGVVWVGRKDRPSGIEGKPADKTALNHPYAFDQRLDQAFEAKRLIAAAARELIQPNQTILLDGGTSTYFLAEELIAKVGLDKASDNGERAGMQLQLVTNSLPIAQLLQNDDSVELVLTGGVIYPRYGVMLGPIADRCLLQIHVHTLFFSVAGINQGRLFNQNLLLVESEKRMMAQAQQVVLLADSTKFGQHALVEICGLDEVDIVVSDAGLSQDWRKQIEGAGGNLALNRFIQLRFLRDFGTRTSEQIKRVEAA